VVKYILIVLINSFLLFETDRVVAQKKLTGIVRGQVVDAARSGIESATALLLKLPDSSLLKGVQTQENGRFHLEDIPPGKYALKISFTGFVTTLVKDVHVSADKTFNTGVIILEKNAQLLDQVVVEVTVPDVQYQLDKTTFNITDDIRGMSTNATQILEQIPMVELDENGVPSVMGQGVTVLIDGRPSRIYGDNIETVLKLIPAGSIEKVEVVTNPSARYTTEQGGIVLNIITKNKHLTGLSGMVSVSTNTNGNLSPSLSINLTGKKTGWNNSISFDYDRDPFKSTLLRENLLDTVFFTNQSREGTDNDRDFSYNTNFYYQFTPTNRIGVFFGLGHDTENEEEILKTSALSSDKELLSAYTRDITGRESSWQYRTGINFEKKFSGNEEHALDVEAYYSGRKDDDDKLFDQQSEWQHLNSLQHEFSTSSDKGFTIDADYVQPFSEKSRLEAGFRAEWETDANNFISKYFDNDFDSYLINDTLSNDFTTRERQFSLYAMYRTEIKSFSFQTGARLENALLETKQRIRNQFFNNHYLNVIPTLNVSYKFKNRDNIAFSYSRRANRPWWRQLNPFIDYSNPENIESGNPDLKPEYINSFEFRYGKFINQFSLFGSVYYRHSKDPIQRISTVNDQGVAYTTFENMGKENYYGLETGFSADVVKEWNVRLNVGLRKNEVLGFEQAYESVGFNARFSTFFPLPAGFRGFAYTRYHAPRAIAQGTQKGTLVSDAGIRKSLFNERANFSLSISDIFNGRKHARSLTYKNFTENSSYQRQSRYVELSISFLFGNLKSQLKNKSNPENRDDPNEQNQREEF
jgi:outer membrane receptor protein involved in Fe transport